MLGTVKLQNGHAAGGETIHYIIPRVELRGVTLKDNTVSWILVSSGITFEVDFYAGEQKSAQVAALFFVELTSETEDVMWENSDEAERWFRNGEEVVISGGAAVVNVKPKSKS